MPHFEPIWAYFREFGPIFGVSGPVFWPILGDLGLCQSLFGPVSGPIWAYFEESMAVLGPIWAYIRASGAVSGPILRDLGLFWDLFMLFGPIFGYLGPFQDLFIGI